MSTSSPRPNREAAGRSSDAVRVEALRPADLTPEQHELYSRILGGPRASGPQHFSLTAPDGSLAGPFNGFLLSPAIGGAVQELGAAVRYRSAISARVRELAILIVAAHWNSAFEVAAHEAVGRAVGLSDDELAEIARGEMPTLIDPVEECCVRVVYAMARGDVDDDLWAETIGVISVETVFELVTLVGYYAGLALQLRVFRVGE